MALPIINTAMCNIKDGMNDFARSAVGTVLTVAATLAAAHNADSAFRIADKEWNIAKKYWNISNNWLNYYKDSYAPAEDKELAEAMNLKNEAAEYEVARGRAKASAWIKFKGLAHKSIRCTSRYCTGRRQYMLEELAVMQADALATCDALGWRNERAYLEARGDVRFSRQFETAKRGRNMVANAHTFGGAAAGIYGKLTDQYWQGLVGAGRFLGYTLNRSSTDYPNFRYELQYGDPIPLRSTQSTGEAGEQLLRQP